MNIETLTDQHSKLAIISSKLVALLVEEDSLLDNISDIESILDNMTDVLSAHLFTEDKLLYPFLAKSNDQEIVKISKEFLSSIGGLKQSYTEYINKWSKETIVESPAGFIKESNEIITALHDRINKEENQLFPLVAQNSKPL